MAEAAVTLRRNKKIAVYSPNRNPNSNPSSNPNVNPNPNPTNNLKNKELISS